MIRDKVEEVAQKKEEKESIKHNGSKLSLSSQTAVVSQKQLISQQQQANRGNEQEMLKYQEAESEQKRNENAIIRGETSKVATTTSVLG